MTLLPISALSILSLVSCFPPSCSICSLTLFPFFTLPLSSHLLITFLPTLSTSSLSFLPSLPSQSFQLSTISSPLFLPFIILSLAYFLPVFHLSFQICVIQNIFTFTLLLEICEKLCFLFILVIQHMFGHIHLVGN